MANLHQLEHNQRLSAGCGAIIGALVGDAAGATLEFLGRKPTPSEVEKAMCMVGGGVHGTAPGQVTDDGELTIALAHSLSGMSQYDPNRAAHFYRKWYLSRPIDIGGATAAALGRGDVDSPTLADEIMKNASRYNSESKANGSLMRASPLGVWSAKVSLADAVQAARMDAQLTHPNPSCQWAGVAYIVAIRHLILHPSDAQGAFLAAETALDSTDAEEVRSWLADAKHGNLPDFYPMAGFVRIGFTHAFYHLARNSSYVDAISTTLLGGGDTDTNACIVGGMVGALHGIQAIPEPMRSAVTRCDTLKGRPRPEWLRPTKVEELILGLL